MRSLISLIICGLLSLTAVADEAPNMRKWVELAKTLPSCEAPVPGDGRAIHLFMGSQFAQIYNFYPSMREEYVFWGNMAAHALIIRGCDEMAGGLLVNLVMDKEASKYDHEVTRRLMMAVR
jgi:hypothetical protein